MFPCARHVILYLVLVQPRKRPNMTENFLTGMADSQGGGTGDPVPPERSLKIEFFSNIGQDPLKDTRPEFNDRPSSGRQRNAI